MWNHLDQSGGGAQQQQQQQQQPAQQMGGGMMQQQSHSQQQQPSQSGWGGGGGGGLMGGLAALGGEDMAKQFAGAQTQELQQRAGACAKVLKPYFRVSNRYVIKKVEMLLFPCRRVLKKDTWQREVGKDPSGDANAPDLYLPLMACITFVLLVGFLDGRRGDFTPDVLGSIMTKSLGLLALEVVAIYVAVRVFKGVPLGWFDVAAYGGYKYLPLCINMLCGLAAGYNGYLGAAVGTGVSYAIFYYQTISAAAFTPPGDGQFATSVASKQKLVAAAIAGAEFLLMFVHGYLGSSRLAYETVATAVAAVAATATAAAPIAAAAATAAAGSLLDGGAVEELIKSTA